MKEINKNSVESTLDTEKNTSTSVVDPIMQQLIYNGKFESTEKTLDLEAMLAILWRGKLVIILISMLFAIASVFIALSIPNVYRSQVLLAPVMDDPSNLGGVASKLGGLASLAGINLQSGGTDKTELTLEIMKSRYFVSKFIEDNNLLLPLMASDGWDVNTNQLSFDADIYDVNSKEWVRKVKPPFQPKPSLQEAHKEFVEILNISRSKDSALIRVSLDHYSPELAQQWLNNFIHMVNNEMRERDLLEAQKNAQYLKEQLALTNVEELKQILYQLIQEQEKNIMFANVRDEYAFKVIDPALIPEERVKPNRILIVFGISLLGLFLSIFLVFFLHNRNES